MVGKEPPLPVSISGRFFLPRRVWALPRTWTPPPPLTATPSRTPLSAEGRGFRHLPALHAHFSFLLSSWEKPRNEFGRNTEGWPGRGRTEPGYSCSTPRLRVCSTERRAKQQSGLFQSEGCTAPLATAPRQEEYSTLGGKMRARERREGGRQSEESGSSYSHNTKSKRQQIGASVRLTEPLWAPVGNTSPN